MIRTPDSKEIAGQEYWFVPRGGFGPRANTDPELGRHLTLSIRTGYFLGLPAQAAGHLAALTPQVQFVPLPGTYVPPLFTPLFMKDIGGAGPDPRCPGKTKRHGSKPLAWKPWGPRGIGRFRPNRTSA